MDCCNKFESMQTSEFEYCASCFSIVDGLCFETSENINTATRDRFNKFKTFIGGKGLSWDAVFTLEELFNKLDGYFYRMDNKRINFVNLSQLTIEMLKVCGFSSQCQFFKPLKTLSRRQFVKRFLDEAIDDYFGTGVKAQSIDITGASYLIPIGDNSEIKNDKIISDNHIYS